MSSQHLNSSVVIGMVINSCGNAHQRLINRVNRHAYIRRFERGHERVYPAKPGYSHCAEPGRSDLHFSTAGRVKQTLTPPSDKTESGIRLYSASALW